MAVEFSGQKGSAVIDNAARTVTVDMADTVDMTHVKLLRFEVTDSTTYSPEIESYLDLSKPNLFILETYPGQFYEWTLSASQTVDRYIVAENQVGKAIFNEDIYHAMFYVIPEQPFETINITQMKLGPEGSVISPDPTTVHDFTTQQVFTLTWRGKSENWIINAYHKEISVETCSADAWARAAQLNGVFDPSLGDPYFLYRKKSDVEWTEVALSEISIKDNTFSAWIKGLTPMTEYLFKACAGEMEGAEISFTTERDAQMINMDFDDWVKEGKSWYPNLDLEDNYWWDSGNKGANTIGEANPTSPEETFVAISGEGKRAARMESVSVLGIMAGGNVFSGKYLKTAGAGAQVAFGRPFDSRPHQLKGWYSYAPKSIDKAKGDYAHMAGKPDRCHIFVYVTDWDEPYVVDTNAKIFLDVNDPHVIGYGEIIDSVGTEGSYKEFTLDIKYRDSRKPKYCAVVAVASQYADYFTGGIGSLLYVDEFSFSYEGLPTIKRE